MMIWKISALCLSYEKITFMCPRIFCIPVELTETMFKFYKILSIPIAYCDEYVVLRLSGWKPGLMYGHSVLQGDGYQDDSQDELLIYLDLQILRSNWMNIRVNCCLFTNRIEIQVYLLTFCLLNLIFLPHLLTCLLPTRAVFNWVKPKPNQLLTN